MGNLNNVIMLTLIRHSQALAQQWEKHSPIKTPTNLIGDMIKVNNYLRIQIGLLNQDTTAIREYLSNEHDVKEWLKNFEKGVIPFLLNNKLPDWN